MSWVAIAGGTVAAAGSLGAAYLSSQASSKGGSASASYSSDQKKAMKAVQKAIGNIKDPATIPNLDWKPTNYDTKWLGLGYQGGVPYGSKLLYGEKVNPINYQDNVNLSYYQPTRGVSQLGQMLGYSGTLSQQAQQDTANNAALREQVAPGSTQMMQQGGNVINAWLRGEVPSDVVQQIQANAASQYGGTTNPFLQNGAAQGGQSALLKNLGLTSLQLQQQGTSAAQSWQNLANSLTTKATDLYGAAANNNAQQYQYDVFNTQTQFEKDLRNYEGRLNYEQMKAAPDPRAVGALNDLLKFNTLNDQNKLLLANNKQQTALNNSQLKYQSDLNKAQLMMGQQAMFQAQATPPQQGFNWGPLVSAGAQAINSYILPAIQNWNSKSSSGPTTGANSTGGAHSMNTNYNSGGPFSP